MPDDKDKDYVKRIAKARMAKSSGRGDKGVRREGSPPKGWSTRGQTNFKGKVPPAPKATTTSHSTSRGVTSGGGSGAGTSGYPGKYDSEVYGTTPGRVGRGLSYDAKFGGMSKTYINQLTAADKKRAAQKNKVKGPRTPQ